MNCPRVVLAMHGPAMRDALFPSRLTARLLDVASCDPALVVTDFAAAPREPIVTADVLLTGWGSPRIDRQGQPGAPVSDLSDYVANYHVLCVGHALDVLGSRFDQPISIVAETSAADLMDQLDALPWADQAWASGHRVDMVGTALRWNIPQQVLGSRGAAEGLVGWLVTRADPRIGMWGSVAGDDGGLLQVVNGFYRAFRGTFAQFGSPLPYPERVVDTVLEHARDAPLFTPARQNACNVLDVVHPLWLARRQTDYRGAEVQDLSTRLSRDLLGHWTDGQGFGSRPCTRRHVRCPGPPRAAGHRDVAGDPLAVGRPRRPLRAGRLPTARDPPARTRAAPGLSGVGALGTLWVGPPRVRTVDGRLTSQLPGPHQTGQRVQHHPATDQRGLFGPVVRR